MSPKTVIKITSREPSLPAFKQLFFPKQCVLLSELLLELSLELPLELMLDLSFKLSLEISKPQDSLEPLETLLEPFLA